MASTPNPAPPMAAGLAQRGLSNDDARSLSVIGTEIFHTACLRALQGPRSQPFAEEVERSHAAIRRLLTA